MSRVRICNTYGIGSLCEGYLFGIILERRTPSIVDGWICNNFKSILELFDGTLFKKIENKKIDLKYKKDVISDIDQDEYIRRYGEWECIHLNSETDDYIENKFRPRKDIFYDYLKNINICEGNYYLYTIRENDEYITQKDLDYVQDKLSFNIYDKIIIINGLRSKIPELFFNKFKCISYNINLNGEKENLWKFK